MNLIRLRGHSNVEAEFNQMTITVQSKKNSLRPTFREIFSPQNRQSLLIVIALATISQ